MSNKYSPRIGKRTPGTPIPKAPVMPKVYREVNGKRYLVAGQGFGGQMLLEIAAYSRTEDIVKAVKHYHMNTMKGKWDEVKLVYVKDGKVTRDATEIPSLVVTSGYSDKGEVLKLVPKEDSMSEAWVNIDFKPVYTGRDVAQLIKGHKLVMMPDIETALSVAFPVQPNESPDIKAARKVYKDGYSRAGLYPLNPGVGSEDFKVRARDQFRYVAEAAVANIPALNPETGAHRKLGRVLPAVFNNLLMLGDFYDFEMDSKYDYNIHYPKETLETTHKLRVPIVYVDGGKVYRTDDIEEMLGARNPDVWGNPFTIDEEVVRGPNMSTYYLYPKYDEYYTHGEARVVNDKFTYEVGAESFRYPAHHIAYSVANVDITRPFVRMLNLRAPCVIPHIGRWGKITMPKGYFTFQPNTVVVERAYDVDDLVDFIYEFSELVCGVKHGLAVTGYDQFNVSAHDARWIGRRVVAYIPSIFDMDLGSFYTEEIGNGYTMPMDQDAHWLFNDEYGVKEVNTWKTFKPWRLFNQADYEEDAKKTFPENRGEINITTEYREYVEPEHEDRETYAKHGMRWDPAE